MNNITNPNLIYPGEILKIPTSISVKSGASDNQHSSTYVVQSGDTLSEIASKFGTTTQYLSRINGISNPNLIYPGEVLKIDTGNVVAFAPSISYEIERIKEQIFMEKFVKCDKIIKI